MCRLKSPVIISSEEMKFSSKEVNSEIKVDLEKG